MGLLDFFKVTKSVDERKPSDAPTQPNAFSRTGTKKTTTTYKDQLDATEAMLHPIVFFCLNKIATSFMSVPWYATEDTSLPINDRASKSAIKEMNKLLNDPNLSLTAAQLRYWIALNFACFRRVPIKVGIGVSGTPSGIYPLATKHTKVTFDAKSMPINYVYGSGSSETILPTKDRANGKSYAYEICHPSLNGTTDPVDMMTPLRAIGLPAQVMRNLLQRAVDTAEGHPNMKYIISAEKTLTDAQQNAVQEFIDDTATGMTESGNILVLHNTVIKVDKLDNDLSDIHSKLPLDDMARVVLRNFGIPVALAGLGAADGAKFANNYEGSRAAFWEDTIIPEYCAPVQDGLTKALCQPGMVIRFDYDEIAALQYARALRVKELTNVTFLTVQEKRELAGYGAIPEGQQLDRPAPVATSQTGAT